MGFPYHIIDLSHTLHEDIPSWNGSCGFQHQVRLDYKDCKSEVKFRVQQMTMHAGIGTHIDAPSHCKEGESSVESLILDNLIAPCSRIDVSDRANANYSLTADEVLAFEKKHGEIKPNSFFIVYTGWEKHWKTPEKYCNDHIFPCVSKEAAELLLERDVAGLGIDTLSPDRPENGFPVHQLLLGNNKYIVENIACAKRLPPNNSFSLALPIKAKGLTEAPIRLVGLVSNEKKRKDALL